MTKAQDFGQEPLKRMIELFYKNYVERKYRIEPVLVQNDESLYLTINKTGPKAFQRTEHKKGDLEIIIELKLHGNPFVLDEGFPYGNDKKDLIKSAYDELEYYSKIKNFYIKKIDDGYKLINMESKGEINILFYPSVKVTTDSPEMVKYLHEIIPLLGIRIPGNSDVKINYSVRGIAEAIKQMPYTLRLQVEELKQLIKSGLE